MHAHNSYVHTILIHTPNSYTQSIHTTGGHHPVDTKLAERTVTALSRAVELQKGGGNQNQNQNHTISDSGQSQNPKSDPDPKSDPNPKSDPDPNQSQIWMSRHGEARSARKNENGLELEYMVMGPQKMVPALDHILGPLQVGNSNSTSKFKYINQV